MLRIYHVECRGGLGLTLEGRLAGPWVEACRSIVAQAEASGHRPCLDLQEVHYADPQGIALLEELDAAGRICRRSAYLATLVAPKEKR